MGSSGKNTFGFVVAGLAAVAIGGYLTFHGGGDTELHAMDPKAPAADAKKPVAGGVPARRALEEGQAWTYDTHLVTMMMVDGNFGQRFTGPSAQVLPNGAKSQTWDVDLAGTVEFGVVKTEAGAAMVRVRIANAKMTATVNGGAVPADAIAATQIELGVGALFRVNANGLVAGFDPGAVKDPFVQQSLKYLGYLAQTVLPTSEKNTTWTASEEDATGTYRASYQALPDGGADVVPVKKTKTGYDSIRVAAGQDANNIKGKVTGKFDLGIRKADGWLDDVKGDESAEVLLGGSDVPATTVTATISMKFSGKRPVSEQERSAFRGKALPTNAASAGSDEAFKASELARAKSAVGTATPASLAQEASGLAALSGQPYEKARMEVFQKTRDWLMVHPRNVGELTEKMRGQGVKDEFYRVGGFALGVVGCDACQKAIFDEIKAHKDDPNTAVYMTQRLADVLTPTAETQAALRELEHASNEDVSKSAVLTAGTMANNLYAGAAAPRADELVDEGIQRLRAAKTEADTLFALAALGNTGSAKLAGALTETLASTSEDVRVSATHTLRFVKDQTATALEGKMLSDPSAKVRAAAADALTFQNPDSSRVKTLVGHLDGEQSPEVRRIIVQGLQTSYAGDETAKAAVKKALNDPNKDVQTAARNIIVMYEPSH